MINVISICTESAKINGPTKVLQNTLKGLDSIGYPYVINRDLSSTKRVWIHSGSKALPYVKKIDAKTVIGPNTALYPSDIEHFDLSKALYLQPGPTSVQFWKHLGFDQCPLRYWAAGIDTEVFSESPNELKDIVLVYHKERESRELFYIIDTLINANQRFALLPYGSYYETDYLYYLSRSKFVIWHGRVESQGIALQEAMSCNVPILVCDVTCLGQTEHSIVKYTGALGRIPATSVPYFSDECGIRITDLSRLPLALEQMEDTWYNFTPRNFILNNLSLETQARKLVRMWEYWHMSEADGKAETLLNSKPFHISTFTRYYKKTIKLLTRK